jgi:uncharacterized repeat protein (TIGR02543 family)
MKKKITAVLMVLSMVLALIPAGMMSVSADTDNWTDVNNYDISWYNATATSFTIDCAAELAGLAVIVNGMNGQTADSFTGKAVSLSANIELNGHRWLPIGYYNSESDKHWFNGTFDGRGHKVSGIGIAVSMDMHYGFFGVAYEDSLIRNVDVAGSIVNNDLPGTAGIFAGGIVGFSDGKILNCSSSVNMDINQCSSAECGGIAGECASEIDNCSFSGTISQPGHVFQIDCGGIAGHSSFANNQITNCSNTGRISAETTAYNASTANAGGILGSGLCNVRNCCNIGSVTANCSVNGFNSIAGGIIGEGNYAENCYNAGVVNATNGSRNNYAGCIIGQLTSPGKVEHCYWQSGIEPDKGAGNTNDAVGTSLSANQMKAATKTENALVDSLNTWVTGQITGSYNTWHQASGTNGGYPYLNPLITICYESADQRMGTVSLESENIKETYGTSSGSTATAKSGYHFVNWTDQEGNQVSTNAVFIPAKNRTSNSYTSATYTANFAADPVHTYYTITASASPSSGGTVTGGGTYVEGTSVTLKASAKEGYTFLGWYEDGKSIGTGATIDIAVSSDRTITAHFRASSSARVFGTTRYDTMTETVKKAFPNGCETAVLASGENWPDALSASSLAGVKDCPVILTEPGQLTQQTADLLASLKVTNVIIVGGTAAISDDMKAAVEAKSITTERIWGSDRTQTADLVARRVIDSSDADTIIICSGQNFPDALSISSYAYAKKMPILLAGSDGKLTADSLAIAENFGKAIIVGGEKAVSPDVEKQLTVMKTARYEGTDRYGTSIDVINKLFGGYAPVLAVATGTNYPDALVGAALAGKSGGTILLVDGGGTSLADDQKAIIGHAGDVWILGGDGAVSDAMKTAINNVLK